ncbi:hypothetical protein COXBURSA334_1255 [Coxiella burnetii Q321]|nr:hypothetical protein COXBURSA334_1255 [Coxiella burnetii Q321]
MGPYTYEAQRNTGTIDDIIVFPYSASLHTGYLLKTYTFNRTRIIPWLNH